ncbi:MAG TPA: outer membrane beta-barrel protein [Longimicrobiaceae bacterium]|nr:outer membrane beta-barrel protein [Longimicrobiaceae bacterium]
MRPTLAAALSALALLAAAPAAAQLSMEVRGGAGAGSYEATSAGFQLIPRPAMSASLDYAPTPLWSVYAGYTYAGFGCEEGFCRGVDPVFTSRGIDAGVRFQLPHGLWVRGGAVMHSLGIESRRGEETFSESSDAAFGLGAGVGIGVRLGNRVIITPGIGYTRYTADTADGSDGVALLTADVGLRISLTGPRGLREARPSYAVPRITPAPPAP